jgi:asparagine synthase (glutamine-hydrolysing)
LDRRIVNFSFCLPYQFRVKHGWNKYILREAMLGILPEEIRQRRSNVHLTALATRGLCQKEKVTIKELLADARVVQAGLVDSRILNYLWDQYWQEEPTTPYSSLNRMLCIESWLRYQKYGKIVSES